MKCAHCDSPVGSTARYCENCGSLVRGGGGDHRLAEAYVQELAGDVGAAALAYEKLLDRDPGGGSAVVRKHLGNLHFRLGHLRRAREHLALACEVQPANAALWHDLGVVLYHMAELDEAVEAFRRAVSLDSELLLAYFWLGNALYHQGDNHAAEAAFRKLVDGYPNFTIARFHLGVIYARMGDKQKAEQEFRRVLMKNPEDAAARFYVSG